MVGNFHGPDVHNPNQRVFITAWKSLTHHRDFMESESYVDLVLPLMEAMAGPGRITQALVDSSQEIELTKALNAPVTQFIYITMKTHHDRGYELMPLVEKLQRELKKYHVCLGSCWGPSVEKEKLHVGIVGWNSVEDRDAAVNGPLGPTIKLMRELSTVELRYANLRQI